MKSSHRLAVLLAVLIAGTGSASAAAILRITEVMSSSGTGGTADWFEVSNLGDTSISLTGFKMDDSSFSSGSAVALNGVGDVGAGESVVFLETALEADITAFRTFWDLAASVQVGRYNGSGVSFGSGGDGVILFDASNIEITRVTFGAATPGTSFEFAYDTMGTPDGGEVASEDGTHGAYATTGSPVNTGSPGAIPEPSAAALLVLPALGLMRRRR